MAGPKRLTTRRGIRLWLIKHAASSKDWHDVAVPDAAFSWLPFTVQTNGYRFRPHPSFNLQEHAGITISKTYYVDRENGNDANTGADWDNALKEINTAWGKGDVDRVYVRDSVFFLDECNVEPTRDVETIGVGEVILSSNCRNDAGSFSAVDNHYEADFGHYRYIGSCYDDTRLDIYGIARSLSKVADIATVDSTPNSFFFNYTGGYNNTMYIRTHDDREPDGDVRYHETGPFFRDADNQTLYFENLTFQNSMRLRNSTATAGSLYCLKRCKTKGITLNAADVILEDCIIEKGEYAGGDGINFNARDGVIVKLVEINCTIKHAPLGGSSDQCSTGHAACQSVRLNPDYFDWGGQIIADVGGCQSWVLGGKLADSAHGDAYYQDGDAWLDHCYLDGDLIEAGSGTIYLRKCTVTGSQSGDIQAY